MAQTSPDAVSGGDPSLAPEGQQKTSLFGKIKSKTKDKTKKLRQKMAHQKGDGVERTAVGGEQDEGSSSSSSSDEETSAPANNQITGATQPAYERGLNAGQEPAESTTSTPEVSPSVPASNFPGQFGGAVTAPKKESSEDTSLSKDFEGLSTSEKPGAPESSPASEGESAKPATEKVTDTLYGAKDKVAEKLPTQEGSDQKDPAAAVSEKTGEVAGKANEAGKTWSEWAAEKVGYAKDETAAKIPDEHKEKAVGVKDAAYDQATTAKDTAYGHATAAKDTVASKTEEYKSSIPSDPAHQTYAQKAFGGLTAAKNSATAPPAQGEKDLSTKITDSVSSLPGTLKTSLGLGGHSASSPTTTSATAKTASAEGEPHGEAPGIVGKFTSLFGGAAKQTEEAASTAHSTAESKVGGADSKVEL